MTIFVNKGEAPLTDAQLEKRSQRYIARDWSPQAREKSIRLSDGSFDAFMATHSANHDINIANNLFNTQLAAYREAVARLDRYVLADGRQEVKEMQPTGEQVFNEETGEMEDVLAEVVVQTAIEPVAEFVEQTSYTEDGETVTESVRNPVIVEDEVQRAEAQSVVDATPQEVIGAYHLESLETVDDSFQRHLD
jgi:hypothetical protein